MRLKSVTAPDRAQALARIRATLGDDAMIVTTQELKGGGVRVTAAVDSEDPDLDDLLAPPEASAEADWLAGIATHHELPGPLRARLAGAASGLAHADPAAALGHALGSLFRFRPLATEAASPLLLSGLPGAGKTASVAKLAARAVLAGRSVRVITTDLERAGGPGQLEALLAPLDIRPEAAPDLAGLKRALAAARADLVLIDSPGCNPFRSADIGRLSALIEASRAEPVLVLAAGGGSADSAEIAQTYAALGGARMLVTKLDAARRLGGMLAAADAGLALAEAGIGPIIGNGLRPLTPAGLARLLLHGQTGGAARTPRERSP